MFVLINNRDLQNCLRDAKYNFKTMWFLFVRFSKKKNGIVCHLLRKISPRLIAGWRVVRKNLEIRKD